MSNIIVMAFSPRNIVGWFALKTLTKGGGSRAPQDPPRYALGAFRKKGTEIIISLFPDVSQTSMITFQIDIRHSRENNLTNKVRY